MPQDPKARYVLVYDGEGGVRMAPAGTRSTGPTQLQPGWDPWDLANAAEIQFEPEAEPAPHRRRHVIASVAGLCALGLALGLTVRSPLVDKAPAKVAASAPLAAKAAPVRVAAIVAAKAPPAASAPVAQAAPHHAVTRIAAPTRLAKATLHHAPAARPAAERRVAQAAPSHRAAEPRREPADCGQSRADAMVCGDSALAAADRRLGQALRAAVLAGAPIEQLHAQQDDWRNRREIAAHMSRDAVARAYEERIDELKAMKPAEPPY